jgi:hypothetical protein
MAEVKQRNPVTTGWTVAIVGLLVALLLGLGLMRIGKQRMAKAAELARPYTVAFAALAENALAPLGKAQDSVTSKDWGQAQTALDEAGKVVTQMEAAASDENRGPVQQVRQALGDAQSKVGQQAGDTGDKLKDLQTRLQAFVDAAKATP